MGSDLIIGHPAKSSSKSLRQISTCNSPQPAIMCYPDSSVRHKTKGSDLDNFFIPSTNLGKSAAFLTSTATLTTGDTEYFMHLMMWASG